MMLKLCVAAGLGTLMCPDSAGAFMQQCAARRGSCALSRCLKAAHTPRAQLHCLCMSAEQPEESKSEPKEQDSASKRQPKQSQPVEKSASDFASMIEKSFVLACSAGDYNEGLRAFISAITKAYEQGLSVPALQFEINMCGNQSAGRPLQAEEVEMRQIWTTLVYLTLEKARWPQRVQRQTQISAPFRNQFDEFVGNIITAHRRGYDLKRLKLEEMMRRGGGQALNEIETAILSQSMRIVFLTIEMMTQTSWSG